MNLDIGAYIILGFIGLLLLVLTVCIWYDIVKFVIKKVKRER